MREQQKSFWMLTMHNKRGAVQRGVQGVVRKPLIDLTRIGETNEISGHGIETTIDGHKVLAGNGRLMKSKNIPYQECDGIGTVIYLAKDGKFAGSILIADTIKPETEDAIRGLKAAGIRRTVMLTGDRKAVGEAVAAKVGIDQAYTELLPADKGRRSRRCWRR